MEQYKYIDFPNKGATIKFTNEMPWFGQKPKLIKKWIVVNKPQMGDCMVCIRTYGRNLEYFLAEINGIDLGRFHCLSFRNASAYYPSSFFIDNNGNVVEHGNWFYMTGRNAEEHNGQIKMLAPTKNLIQLFIDNQANHLYVQGINIRIGEIGT